MIYYEIIYNIYSKQMVTNNLKKIRVQKNITQEKLSIITKIGRSTIAEIENGTHLPRIDTALMIARALDVRVDELFIFDQERKERNT